MPSFRKAAKQAEHAVRQNLALGAARHSSRADGKIHSVGTARAYQQSLTTAAQWLQDHGCMDGLHRMTPEQAERYLAERADYVSQSTLDLDRQALQTLPHIDKLDRARAALGRTELATESRAYTATQVHMIAAAQSQRHGLATEIAHAAGLRAHELLTLRPAAEQAASTHRTWTDTRFTGREEHMRYSVVGKGGLARDVALPRDLAERLEARRLDEPAPVTDRRVRYTQHYDLGGGKNWSQSFSAASQRELEWSSGAHGLRHAYAQERMEELQRSGLAYPEALGVVSQEMGHFRADITEVYLR